MLLQLKIEYWEKVLSRGEQNFFLTQSFAQGSAVEKGRIDVLGVSWDSTIGGAAMTDRLRDTLAHLADKDPSRDARAMARLRASADKAKIVLSANREVCKTLCGRSFHKDPRSDAVILVRLRASAEREK